MNKRMSLVVFSGTADKLTAVATLATGAAAMGMDVELFLTFWGLEAFRKGAKTQPPRIAAEFADEIGALLSDASAYGDSQHDLDLLQAVGDPVAVMPDPPLLETARGNRWHIIRSRNVPHVLPQ